MDGAMTRERLPDRRTSEVLTIDHPEHLEDARWRVAVTLSRFPDGRPAEVFVHALYGSGSLVEADARDAAVVLSIALQYGVPLEPIRAALTRHEDGRPCGLMGAVVDALASTD